MTANTRRGQIKITVHHARRTLRTVHPVLRGPPYCRAPRGQRFLLCSLSGSQPLPPPAEAAALLAEARVTSAGIFCPPRGSPRSPCNPSHSCRFDTFLYKGNTSRGRNFLSCKKLDRVAKWNTRWCGKWREIQCHDTDGHVRKSLQYHLVYHNLI